MSGRLAGATVLVTGARGFIGQHLVRAVLAEGAVRVVATTRSGPGDAGVSWVRADLAEVDGETWRGAGVARFDAVFHLAGAIRRAPGAEDLDRLYRDNVVATRRLLESLPETGRIVYASTTDVYGRSPVSPVTEATPTAPDTMYAAAKLFGEHVVRLFARERGIATAILRYGNTYGPGDGEFKKLVPVLARQVACGERPVLTGHPDSERDLIHVADVVEATLRAATADATEVGPLNVVGGRSYAISNVATTLLRLAGRDEAELELTRVGTPDSVRFDASRLRSVLGEWHPVALEDGLRGELEDARRSVVG